MIPAELRDLAKQEFGVRNVFLIGLDTDSLQVAKDITIGPWPACAIS